jgi:hypothetical protein
MKYVHPAQDKVERRALVITAMNTWVPQKTGNLLTSTGIISFLKKYLLLADYQLQHYTPTVCLDTICE